MSNIKLFQDKKIRATFNESDQKWYFSVADVVEVLTESNDVKQYIKRMRSRDSELNTNWGTICTPLEMIAKDGKKRKVQTSNTEGLLRIIQSIPSPKAEPFKRWLAKVGAERLEEIENPELASKRAREIYKVKGYSDDWIEKRMRGIACLAPIYIFGVGSNFLKTIYNEKSHCIYSISTRAKPKPSGAMSNFFLRKYHIQSGT